MKLKRIESILKRKKTIFVYQDADGIQWIGDGRAFYPIYQLPILSEDSIYAMFDISDSQQEKFIFDERELPADLNFTDYDKSDALLSRSGISINTFAASNLEPIYVSSGVEFIERIYLTPFEKLETGYEIYERTTSSGEVYFAIKNGLILLGVVTPYPLITEQFAKDFNELNRLIQVSYDNRAKRFASGEDDD